MSRSKKLFKLQQLDSKIDSHRKRISEIDKILADDSELQQAAKLESKKASFLAEKEKDLRSAEALVEDQQFKIERNKKKLYGGQVTNPKELEDLQLESDALHDYLAVLEERQLEAMLELDEARQNHKQAERALDKIRDQWDKLVQELSAERDQLTKNIQELQNKRPELTSDLKTEDFQLYEQVRKNSGGVAVAAMKEKSCTACGSLIPSALAQQASSPTKIAQCSTCNRILHRV